MNPDATAALKRVQELLEGQAPDDGAQHASSPEPGASESAVASQPAAPADEAPKPLVDRGKIYIARRVVAQKGRALDPVNSDAVLQKELAACDEIIRYFGFPYTTPPVPRRPLAGIVVRFLARLLNWYMKPSIDLSAHTVLAVKELQRQNAILRREIADLRQSTAPRDGESTPGNIAT